MAGLVTLHVTMPLLIPDVTRCPVSRVLHSRGHGGRRRGLGKGESMALRVLRRHGWVAGMGIGRHNQGRREPILPEPHKDRQGVGWYVWRAGVVRLMYRRPMLPGKVRDVEGASCKLRGRAENCVSGLVLQATDKPPLNVGRFFYRRRGVLGFV